MTLKAKKIFWTLTIFYILSIVWNIYSDLIIASTISMVIAIIYALYVLLMTIPKKS